MRVVAIDPGYQQSAYVVWDGEQVLYRGTYPNEDMLRGLHWLYHHPPVVYVFEQVESYGMAVGREVFQTVFVTGRMYQQACSTASPSQAVLMPRRAVKLHLCHSAKAKDSNIRQALIDRFGGTKAEAIGTKAKPGPLYGIRADEWAALAIAVTWWDQQQAQEATA